MFVLYIGTLYANHMQSAAVWDLGILSNVLHTFDRQLIALFALSWILPLLYGLYGIPSTKRIISFIVRTGRNSLAIYYFQTLIFILVSRICHLLPTFGFWGVFIGGIVITSECLLLAQWCKRYKAMRLLILGDR